MSQQKASASVCRVTTSAIAYPGAVTLLTARNHTPRLETLTANSLTAVFQVRWLMTATLSGGCGCPECSVSGSRVGRSGLGRVAPPSALSPTRLPLGAVACPPTYNHAFRLGCCSEVRCLHMLPGKPGSSHVSVPSLIQATWSCTLSLGHPLSFCIGIFSLLCWFPSAHLSS